MAFTTLVDTTTLAAHLADPGFAIVDCRFALTDDGWGEREYAARHIPGAVLAHLGRDLAGSRTGQNGRHPLPDPGELAMTLGRLGIGDGMQVVAYDQDSGMYAGRLWWLLRWLGHDSVAVLNGGFARWLAEGRGTSAGHEHRRRLEFHGAPRADMTVTADQVSALIGASGARLVDARAPERYRGDVEPIDNVAGHIPGAVNHPFKSNLTETGVFRSADELRERLGASLGDLPPDRIVCYCGSGVTACHNLLALEHAGLRGAKLYPGSWSEWSSDPSRPIERGDA
jgi:thiosulfate/3-mercaptopyruvate sulfurtransferase